MKKLILVLTFLFSVSPSLVLAQSAPTISYIEPTNVNVGDTVYVYGTNFNTATFVAIYGNNTFINSTYISPNKLSFVVPSLNPSEYTLGVAEKAGPWDLGSSAKLTVGPIPQAPSISYINPASVKTGETVYVYGTNFNTATFIGVDGGKGPVLDTTYVSPTTLRFVVPSSLAVGTHTLGVAEKAGSWDLSAPVKITIISSSAKMPYSVAPIEPTKTPVQTTTITEPQKQEQIIQLQKLIQQLIMQLIELLQKQAAAAITSQSR